MKDIRYPTKLPFPVRRINIYGDNYTIRPSFIMPYNTGMTSDVEPAMFLRKFDVPYWGLAHVFGRDPTYWYRIEQSLGRNSLVGTTIKDPEKLAEHISADEKHSWILGEKIYVATIVGNECILGVKPATNAGEIALVKAYSVFKEESQLLKQDYSPISGNTDGWGPTKKALKTLFPSITLILCFLHAFIKIRLCGRKKFKDSFIEVASKLWDCYKAKTKSSFSQRVRRLHEWGKKAAIPTAFLERIEKLRNNLSCFSVAYDFPKAHRTSNMLDRLMRRMDCHLFSVQYFHGSIDSAERGIRAWALIYNFAPSNPNTLRKYNNGYNSPAERLNQFSYHENWLRNLLISASLGGYRTYPPNP